MNSKATHWLTGVGFALMLAVASMSLVFTHAHAAALSPITTSLAVGSRGQDVTTLQTLLATSHTLYPLGLVTGYYGPATQAAVMQFQIEYGIAPVGTVGPITRAQLNSIIENTAYIDADAAFITNVMVTPSTTGATITWNTNKSTVGKVHYDSVPIVMIENSVSKTEPQTSGTVLSEGASGTSHTISISGLNPNQTYYYSIVSTDGSQNISVTIPASFTTQ